MTTRRFFLSLLPAAPFAWLFGKQTEAAPASPAPLFFGPEQAKLSCEGAKKIAFDALREQKRLRKENEELKAKLASTAPLTSAPIYEGFLVPNRSDDQTKAGHTCLIQVFLTNDATPEQIASLFDNAEDHLSTFEIEFVRKLALQHSTTWDEYWRRYQAAREALSPLCYAKKRRLNLIAANSPAPA